MSFEEIYNQAILLAKGGDNMLEWFPTPSFKEYVISIQGKRSKCKGKKKKKGGR